MDIFQVNEAETLSTKKAVEFLLDGSLRLKVCRYCLKICSNMCELDEILEIGTESGLHEVKIRDMMACFYPYKVEANAYLPNKICDECLDSAMKAYLFTQQCERAERAIRNCLEDIQEKYDKLDPIEPIKKRGKRKLNPNTDTIYVENENVIDYAKPVINIINTNSILLHNVEINALECQKCWQSQPSPQALVVHEESHPKNMWYNCKACGKSFVKRFHLKQHIRKTHKLGDHEKIPTVAFNCTECGDYSTNLGKHYQHIEKHKFKMMLRNILDGKTERLCVLCLEEGTKMTDLSENIILHGGYPELNGEFVIKHILASVFQKIPFLNFGKKVCETCLNHVLGFYIFTSKLEYVQNRLDKCVTHVFGSLHSIQAIQKTMMIEISSDVVLPIEDFVKEEDPNEFREDTIEVLEDEFREDIIEESSSESEEENLAKKVVNTYSRQHRKNGYNKLNDIRDFLIFKPTVKHEIFKCYFTCPICNKYFISDYFLKKHVLKHNNKVSECGKCFKQFKSKFHLFEHTKMVHVLKKMNFISCEVCGRSFNSVNKFKQHRICHIQKECHLCNKYFNDQDSFVTHIQRHVARYRVNNTNKHTCSFCEKSYSNKNELSLHVNKIHIRMKPYNCDMCERSYYAQYNLKSHKKLHSLYSKEICMFCSKTYKCRKSLVIHVRKHIGMKPHQCPLCNETYYSENSMKKHMNNTHGGKFLCSICKAVYKFAHTLRLHMSIAHSMD